MLFLNVLLPSHNKVDLKQLIEKLDDCLMQYNLAINLNKTELLSADPNDSGPVTAGGSNLIKTDDLLSTSFRLSYKIVSCINGGGVLRRGE